MKEVQPNEAYNEDCSLGNALPLSNPIPTHLRHMLPLVENVAQPDVSEAHADIATKGQLALQNVLAS